MTQRILFDVVVWGGAITSLVAASLLWQCWKLHNLAKAKVQRELTYALQRAGRRR